MKIYRFQILYQIVRTHLRRLASPNRVLTMTFNGRPLSDDVPFSISATVGSASGHTHGARCGLGTSSIEVEGGLAFHRILPMGSDTEDMPAGRYDYFCLPPVGDPATDCYPAFGFCETN